MQLFLFHYSASNRYRHYEDEADVEAVKLGNCWMCTKCFLRGRRKDSSKLFYDLVYKVTPEKFKQRPNVDMFFTNKRDYATKSEVIPIMLDQYERNALCEVHTRVLDRLRADGVRVSLNQTNRLAVRLLGKDRVFSPESWQVKQVEWDVAQGWLQEQLARERGCDGAAAGSALVGGALETKEMERDAVGAAADEAEMTGAAAAATSEEGLAFEEDVD